MELYRPPAQKAVVTDVLLSLSPAPQRPQPPASDEACSLGKSLKLSQLPALAAAARPAQAGGLALVLTAQDVAVEGFCASRCGHHGSYGGGGAGSSTRAAYAWVGNPAAR